MRIGLAEFFQLDERELFARDVLALGLADAFHFEPEGHVAERGAPREKLREILEHDAAVEPVAVHRLAADADLAAGRTEEARDQIEQRGLAAA